MIIISGFFFNLPAKEVGEVGVCVCIMGLGMRALLLCASSLLVFHFPLCLHPDLFPLPVPLTLLSSVLSMIYPVEPLHPSF